ncbi:hypothetical protein B0T14DRAFT_603011 [Immersiella caudata]|uniref:Uncharacterized protein n=1 Tax=Immersiella caudata TaxID=314043 RepID=A0AA39WPG3_9PEZI|nr:hypothetical protein B0T14DRAFT_603011 [Immersiella caudata]
MIATKTLTKSRYSASRSTILATISRPKHACLFASEPKSKDPLDFWYQQSRERSRSQLISITIKNVPVESAQGLFNEKVALHVQVTEVQCEKVFIFDGELLIIRNAEGKFRLVILSRNECTTMSQEWKGERKVYRYPKELKFLDFHSAYAERMFELGRIAVSQAAIIPPYEGIGTEQ